MLIDKTTPTTQDTEPDPLRESLDKAHDAAHLARAKREQAGVELERARQIAESHRRRSQDAVALSAAATIDDAPRLAQLARDAEAMTAAAARRLLGAQELYTKRDAEVRDAEVRVRRGVDLILSVEDEQLATQILFHEAEAVRLREVLLGYIPDELNTPINRLPLIQLSPNINRALDAPAALSVSRYRQMVMENGPHRARIEAARRNRNDRRAELERGSLATGK